MDVILTKLLIKFKEKKLYSMSLDNEKNNTANFWIFESNKGSNVDLFLGSINVKEPIIKNNNMNFVVSSEFLVASISSFELVEFLLFISKDLYIESGYSIEGNMNKSLLHNLKEIFLYFISKKHSINDFFKVSRKIY